MSVQFDFHNKVIALSGAASGIGLETIKLLAASGAKLSISDIQERPLQRVASEIDEGTGQVFTSVVNIRDKA